MAIMNKIRENEMINSSRMSHGDRVDAGMDMQIKDINNKLRVLNFGQ